MCLFCVSMCITTSCFATLAKCALTENYVFFTVKWARTTFNICYILFSSNICFADGTHSLVKRYYSSIVLTICAVCSLPTRLFCIFNLLLLKLVWFWAWLPFETHSNRKCRPALYMKNGYDEMMIEALFNAHANHVCLLGTNLHQIYVSYFNFLCVRIRYV